MALLSDSDIAEMRDAWESALFDTCVLQTRTAGNTGYGYGQPSYSDGSPVACLFTPALLGESAVNQVQNIDGHVLFSRATSLNNLMRIKITKLHGAALSPTQVYEVVDGPIMHHVGQKVRVRLVRDGSAT